jgi:hypothetical protein
VALLGKALLINWSNVLPEHRQRYFAWHDREHMPGRLALPGFVRGRRLWAKGADRDVLKLYEVNDLDVLTGPAYTAKTANPTLSYREVGRQITEAVRALARVGFSQGTALGGWMMTIRSPAADGGGLYSAHMLRLLEQVADLDGVVGVHACISDLGASSVVTADRIGRATEVPGWAILVEAIFPEALELCRARLLSDTVLHAAGFTGPFHAGTYSLQTVMTKQDLVGGGSDVHEGLKMRRMAADGQTKA